MTIKNTKVQVASLVLIFTLSFVFFADQHYFSGKADNEQSGSGSRSIASIGDVTMVPQELTRVQENQLAEDLAKVDPRRSLASIGAPASDLESLRFGKLEGRYAFKMDGDHVSQISLSGDSNNGVAVTDRADFLKQFSSQFGVTNAPKRVSAVSKGDTLIETYRMKSAAGANDRLIRVTIGEANSLLEINSEVAPENHLF